MCVVTCLIRNVCWIAGRSIAGESSYFAITSGCPADHVGGFKYGGLKRMLSECRSRSVETSAIL